ncbi:hypothetical protein CEW46_21115, partial [Bacillus cereus]
FFHESQLRKVLLFLLIGTLVLVHRVNPYRGPEQAFQLKEMVNLFEVGSRERKVIVMKAFSENVYSMEEALELEPNLTSEDLMSLEPGKEYCFAQVLGWKGSNVGSYRALKKRIASTVSEYLKG